MTSCSGLPICLSGIRIFPQGQRPMPQNLRSTGMQGRARSPRHHASARFANAESLASDCETMSPTAMVAMHSTHISRGNSCARQGSNFELSPNPPDSPRLALAQEMAELDSRREAIRRRGLQTSSSLMDYRLSSLQNDSLSACLESQSRLEDQSDMSICAKAA